MKLLALQTIQDAVGTIAEGQLFHAEEDHGLKLIEGGKAIRPEQRVIWNKLPWPGSHVCIIASGPSLNKADCDLVYEWRMKGGPQVRRVIVINTSYQLAPFADVLYACDVRWWERYYKELGNFAGQLWTQSQNAPDPAKFPRVNVVKSVAERGLNRRVGVINQAHNSGYQAVGLAYQAGAERIILLGYDMGEDAKGRGHWHPDHPGRLHSFPNYRVWLDYFAGLEKDLRALNIEVVNSSRRTAMRCFPLVPLEEALA